MIPLYVGSITEFSGKHFVALGLGLAFKEDGLNVGHFKQYGLSPERRGDLVVDRDAEFFCKSLDIQDSMGDVCPVVITEDFTSRMLTHGIQDMSGKIFDAFKKVSADKDVVIVGGVAHVCCGFIVGITEKQFVEDVDARVILTVKLDETAETLDSILAVKEQIKDRFKGVIFNRVPESKLDYADKLVRPFMESHGINVYGIIRNDPVLGAVPIADLVEELGGTVLIGEDKTDELVERFMIGAMNVSSALKHFRKARNKAVITGGDRSDIQLAALETSTKCLILTGEMYPNAAILTKAEEAGVPIVVVTQDTAEAVDRCDALMGHLSLRAPKKLDQARNTFKTSVDLKKIKKDCGI